MYPAQCRCLEMHTVVYNSQCPSEHCVTINLYLQCWLTYNDLPLILWSNVAENGLQFTLLNCPRRTRSVFNCKALSQIVFWSQQAHHFIIGLPLSIPDLTELPNYQNTASWLVRNDVFDYSYNNCCIIFPNDRPTKQVLVLLARSWCTDLPVSFSITMGFPPTNIFRL